MAIPVQSDFWDQIGTNGSESLLGGQLWPWGGGGFLLGTSNSSESMWERQGRGVDVTRGLWPPGCCDGAAGEGATNGQHSHFYTCLRALRLKGAVGVQGRQVAETGRSLRAHPPWSQGSLLGLKGLPLVDNLRGKKDTASSFSTQAAILCRPWQDSW